MFAYGLLVHAFVDSIYVLSQEENKGESATQDPTADPAGSKAPEAQLPEEETKKLEVFEPLRVFRKKLRNTRSRLTLPG